MSKHYCIVVQDYISLDDPSTIFGTSYLYKDLNIHYKLEYFNGVYFDKNEATKIALKYIEKAKTYDCPIECLVSVIRLEDGEEMFSVWEEKVTIFDNINYEKFMEVKKNA